MQSCVCQPSLDGTQPDYVISHDDNSPIDLVHRFAQLFILLECELVL